MTKLKFFTLFILTFLLLSCNSEDTAETLDGTWRLRTASAPEGSVIDYTEGQVNWTFNQDSHRLTVQNNITSLGPENIFSGIASGTYNYNIVETDGNKILYIEGVEQGIFAYTDANLVINSEPDANGIIKVFKR